MRHAQGAAGARKVDEARARQAKPKPTVQADTEEMTILRPGDLSNPAEIPEGRTDTGPGMVVGSALDRNPPSADDAAAQAPRPRLYRVIRGGFYADPNTKARTRIPEGKELDTLNYDVRSLQRSGIKLKEIDPEERGAFDDDLG